MPPKRKGKSTRKNVPAGAAAAGATGSSTYTLPDAPTRTPGIRRCKSLPPVPPATPRGVLIDEDKNTNKGISPKWSPGTPKPAKDVEKIPKTKLVLSLDTPTKEVVEEEKSILMEYDERWGPIFENSIHESEELETFVVESERQATLASSSRKQKIDLTTYYSHTRLFHVITLSLSLSLSLP